MLIKNIEELIDDIEVKLKPCPFCGGKAETDYAWDDYNNPGVHCNDCGAYVFDYNSEKKAIEKWNRRTNEE